MNSPASGLGGMGRQAPAIAAAAALFHGYAAALPTLTLPEVAASFDLAQNSAIVTKAIFYVGLGSFVAVVGAALSDRVGRRRSLLASVLLTVLLSTATALSADLEIFALLQFFARISLITVFAAAVAVALEEAPAERRGFHGALVAASAAAGLAVAAVLRLFVRAVAGSEDAAWRLLFLIALGGLLIVWLVYRDLPESSTWTAAAKARRGGAAAKARRGGAVRSLLSRGYRRQLFQLGAVFFLSYFGFMGAATWWTAFAVRERGIAGADARAVVAVAFLFGLAGYLVFGRLQDLLGRRRTGTICLLATTACGFVVFRAPEELVIFPALAAGAFFALGASGVLTVLSGELPPATARATSVAAARGIFGTLGAIAGPLVVGGAAADPGLLGSIGEGALLVLLALLPAALILHLLPETGRRKLSSIDAAAAIPQETALVPAAAAPFEPYRPASEIKSRTMVTNPEQDAPKRPPEETGRDF